MKQIFTLLMIFLSLNTFAISVTVKVDMTGQDTTNGVYVTGHLTADPETGDWLIQPLSHEGNMIFSWTTNLTPGDTIVYYYLTTDSWDNYLDYRETVPAECDFSAELAGWEGDRAFIVPTATAVVNDIWEDCGDVITDLDARSSENMNIEIYPNPASGILNIDLNSDNNITSIDILDFSGKTLRDYLASGNHIQIDISDMPTNIYLIRISAGNTISYNKVIVR